MTNYSLRLHTDSSAPDNKDHTLIVIGWKRPQKVTEAEWRKTAPPTYSISVPTPVIDISPSILSDILSKSYLSIISSFIRERVVDTDPFTRLGLVIPASELTPSAIALWHNTNNSGGGRLSGEAIGEWFDSDLADPLLVALANKMSLSDTPTEKETAALDRAISEHRIRYCKLAGPQTNYKPPVAEALLRALKLSPVTTTSEKLAKKLTTFLAPKDEDDAFSGL